MFKFSLNWLLIALPAVAAVEIFRPEAHTALFVLSCIAIIPLAGWLGHATEQITHKTGEGVGGLLNATFGNAAELIIAIMALRAGMYDVVKASLTGSIIGNILLVLGAAFVAGGLRHQQQDFNMTGARSQSTILTLAAIGLLVPAMYHHLFGSLPGVVEQTLSFDISVVLMLTYILSLVFALKTHKHLFCGTATCEVDEAHPVEEIWSTKKSIVVLALASAMIGWMAEILVASVEHTAHAFGMNSVFVGVIVVAIVGNAAEHSTAILVAMKNKMDLSIGIAIGSSIQIALFVAPLLVFLSYFIGPQPMDLVLTPAEILAVVLSIHIMGQIAGDGKSNWFEGVQLLSVYVMLGLIFYFVPESQPVAH